MTPLTYFHDWLSNLIASAPGILDDADRLHLGKEHRKSLESSIALYENLRKLVDTGIPPAVGRVTPIDRQIAEKVRVGIERWTTRVTREVPNVPISESERMEFFDTLKTADAMRAYLASYPIVPSDSRGT